ncbi:MAG: Type 1 glutamine amidotransferase-like domain-containing protein [Candidatus Nanoarchaeia archaeon]
MGKIIAIGGGEIGRPGYSIETESIDKETIKISGKKHPKLLFIPTASSDSEGYCQVVKNYFGKRLGCNVDFLRLKREAPSKKEIEKKILSSDIIYVGGGNTLKMMNIWRKTGTDKILAKAYKKGIVLSGVSAGAICWFRYGNSDSRKFTSDSSKLIKVTGLGFIDALNCPHFDEEKHRKKDLMRMMKNTSVVAIALDSCSALEIIDDKYRIITSRKNAKAYKVFWKTGKYNVREIKSVKEFMFLSDLLNK